MGFDHISLSPPLIPENHQQAFKAWCDRGSAADMAYLTRNPDKRLHPVQVFPSVQSILTVGVSYFQGPAPKPRGPGTGRVARYAWGRDYHVVIQDRLKIFLRQFSSYVGPIADSPVAVDTQPILERAIAASAGLGFVGKNTLLIAPRFHLGSFIFLAEVLLNIPFKGVPLAEEKQGCGLCRHCLDACPTQALAEPYHLESNRCISYLTIENKGWIDRSLRPLLGQWIFGCDLCQDICPFNVRARETRWPEFQSDHGVGAWVSLPDIFAIGDDRQFQMQFGHTPLSRPKRKGLIRNACVVAGNSGDKSLIRFIKPLLDDPEPMIRGHALGALGRLMDTPELGDLVNRHLDKETNPSVQEEARAVLGEMS